VHGVNQTKTLLYAALINEFLDLRCDVDESPSIRNLEPKMFSERFHDTNLSGKQENRKCISRFPSLVIKSKISAADSLSN
jgi:hypothetical protein